MNNRKESNVNRFLLRQNTARGITNHQPTSPHPLRSSTTPVAAAAGYSLGRCDSTAARAIAAADRRQHAAAAAATVTALPLQPSLRCRCNRHCAAAATITALPPLLLLLLLCLMVAAAYLFVACTMYLSVPVFACLYSRVYMPGRSEFLRASHPSLGDPAQLGCVLARPCSGHERTIPGTLERSGIDAAVSTACVCDTPPRSLQSSLQ
jgi:hypothetical protein